MAQKYDLVIFDLDGTLADTSPGIYGAHRYAAAAMGIELTKHSLDGVIGGALMDIYTQRFHLDVSGARHAIDAYRDYYKRRGLFEAQIYPGVTALLRALRAQNVRTAVATLKREDFAREMLSRLEVAPLFDWIYGMDENDTLTKRALLEKCALSAGLPIKSCVLIGDSRYDAQGAQACGMDFMGVLYGFGFTAPEDVAAFDNARFCARTPDELADRLIG
jgi:phosphoglycolate phosphatase